MTTDLQLNTPCLNTSNGGGKGSVSASVVGSLKNVATQMYRTSSNGIKKIGSTSRTFSRSAFKNFGSTSSRALLGRKNGATNNNGANNKKQTEEDVRQSLKFCAKNFVNKWSEDLEKHYEMGDLLGEGAYGNVYSCTCLQTGAERAVKVILKSMDDKQNEMVIREFEVLKELDHPNILKNYALYETKTHFHIVTDYIRGGELYDVLEREFTEDEVRSLMKAMLSCMNYCHQQQIVHRDLKPENVLLDGAVSDCDGDFSQVKVIDFGLAQFFRGSTEEGGSFTEQVGSSYYMSPQVIEGKYSSKCDVWSCGIIAYVCLGGYAPFAGEDDVETAQQILDAEQVYFDDPNWDVISDDALDFIEYLLTFDETKRPTAAEALQHEWLQQTTSTKRLSMESCHSARESLESLRSFQAADSKLKQCTYSLIASQIVRKEDKEQVDRMFQILDVDCDGKISSEDMKSIYNDQFGVDLAEDDVNAIIYEVNLCGSGCITYSEFVIASLKEKGLVSENNLELAFKILDKKESGYLAVEDLMDVLDVPEGMEDYVRRKIVAPADFDDDGKISFQDFKEYFAADGLIDASMTNHLRKQSRRRSSASSSLRASARKSFRASALSADAALDKVREELNDSYNFKTLLNSFEGQNDNAGGAAPKVITMTPDTAAQVR